MAKRHNKVIILGSGPAGCTAAIYSARANLKPLQIVGPQPGGQLTITTEVENYPGFVDPVLGFDLMESMQKQAENSGAEVVYDTIVSVNLDSKPFECVGEDGEIYTCDSLIIATGAKARWLGVDGEEYYRGFGVSACATCDGGLFRGKRVAVVGGGNTAVEEALYLANLAESVTLIHRGDKLRAEQVLQKRLFENPKIKVFWNHKIKKIIGTEVPYKHVTEVLLENVTEKTESILSLDAVFMAIGYDPATDLFKGKLDLDHQNFIIAKPGSTETCIPGVFAAGDVRDPVYRQAVTSAGFGCMAAQDAKKYLDHM